MGKLVIFMWSDNVLIMLSHRGWAECGTEPA